VRLSFKELIEEKYKIVRKEKIHETEFIIASLEAP
jgi:hypothetical protein